MKKLLRQIYNKCVKRYLPQSFRKKLKQADAQEYPIIMHPEEMYEKVYHIKDATWEAMEMPEVYEMSKSYKFTMFHDAQDILLIPNARVSHESDVVQTQDGVIWDKFYTKIFNYSIPHDSNVAGYTKETILVRHPQRVENVEGECVSLLGRYSTLWCHFMMQFLPKLYYCDKAGILKKGVTLLIPSTNDPHIRLLISDVMKKNPTSRLLEVNDRDRVEYVCEKLYYLPTAAVLSNDTIFPMLLHQVIPSTVIDSLMENMIKPYVEQIKDEPCAHDKIYLVRRGTYRALDNWQEVEDYFQSLGFYFVEPHKLDWMEKVKLFYHARVIAGPQSSAWSNAIFSQKAKGLMFIPISWTTDSVAGYNIKPEQCKMLQVPGVEDYKSTQSNYHVDLEEIKSAYKQLMEE